MNVKKTPPYSMWQNIGYIIGDMWCWERKLFLMSAGRAPLLVLLPLLAILMPKLVLDCLTAKAPPSTLAGVIGLVTLGLVLCGALNQYLNGRVTLDVIFHRVRLINLINQKTLDMDYENLEAPDVQEKLEKTIEANRDGNTGTEAIVNQLVLFTADLLGLLLYGAILSALNPLLVLFPLLTTAASFFAACRAQTYEHHNKDNWAPIERKLWYLMDRCADFAAGKDIRLYGMSAWFASLFSLLVDERALWYWRIEEHYYAADVIDNLMVLFRDGVTYAYLIYLAVSGSVSVANFTLYFGAMAGFSLWLSGATTGLGQINRMSLVICDVRDYLEFPDRFNRAQGVPLPPREAWPCDVEFQHVSFHYPSGKKVLDDFNLKIKAGEKIALVGVNGAGKSTCVKLLCGLIRPNAGQILVNGQEVHAYSRDEYFKLITVVFQDIHVLPVSIAQTIAPDDALPIDSAKVWRCLEQAGLAQRVGELQNGIDTPLVKEINDEAAQFSGGELQKLLLARALYKDSPLLVLDEPTAALDPIAENDLYQRYAALTRNRTSLYISHRLSSTRFCDRIIFLSAGKIAESGSHEELMRLNGKYAQMFEIQSHYYQDHIDEIETEDEYYERIFAGQEF